MNAARKYMATASTVRHGNKLRPRDLAQLSVRPSCLTIFTRRDPNKSWRARNPAGYQRSWVREALTRNHNLGDGLDLELNWESVHLVGGRAVGGHLISER